MGNNFLFSIIKLFIAILLIPLVCSMVLSFYNHIQAYPVSYESSFLIGLAAFLFLFVFLYQFWRVYEFGQKAVSAIFKFAAPFDRFLSLVMPFYVILTLSLFYVTKNLLNNNNNDYIFMFFVGFFAAMHLILSSQELQEKEDSPVKPTYYVEIFLLMFFLILILIFGVDLVREKWTFPKFYNVTLKIANKAYYMLMERTLFFK